jgi:hypothetical protein
LVLVPPDRAGHGEGGEDEGDDGEGKAEIPSALAGFAAEADEDAEVGEGDGGGGTTTAAEGHEEEGGEQQEQPSGVGEAEMFQKGAHAIW